MSVNTNIKKGFTLIELLVVVLIIGILAAVALPQYQYAAEKAKYQKVVAVADAIYKAEVIFRLANGYYTTDFSKLDLTIPGVNFERSSDTAGVWAQRFLGDAIECVLTTDPALSVSTKITCSTSTANGAQYGVWFGKENAPRVCISSNEKQEKFCQRITGSEKAEGWAWVNNWVWPHK